MSDEAHITEAQIPIKLSGPYVLRVSESRAVEPLPESGLTMISEVSSEGIPKTDVIPCIHFASISQAPLARNMDVAVKIKTRIGIREKVPDTPSIAPEMKLCWMSFLLNIQPKPNTPSINGMIYEDIFNT